MGAGRSMSSKKTMSWMIENYCRIMEDLNLQPFPTEDTKFYVFIGKKLQDNSSIRADTLKRYLQAILKWERTTQGGSKDLSWKEFPETKKFLADIRANLTPTKTLSHAKEAFTPEDFKRIQEFAFQSGPGSKTFAAFTTLCILTFGAHRVGSVLGRDREPFDEERFISLAKLKEVKQGSNAWCEQSITKHKLSHRGKVLNVILPRLENNPFCPIAAIYVMLSAHPLISTETQIIGNTRWKGFFIGYLKDGIWETLTYEECNKEIKSWGYNLNLEKKNRYGTHSGKKTLTTFAVKEKIDDNTIAKMNNWTSTTEVFRYYNPEKGAIVEAAKKVGNSMKGQPKTLVSSTEQTSIGTETEQSWIKWTELKAPKLITKKIEGIIKDRAGNLSEHWKERLREVASIKMGESLFARFCYFAASRVRVKFHALVSQTIFRKTELDRLIGGVEQKDVKARKLRELMKECMLIEEASEFTKHCVEVGFLRREEINLFPKSPPGKSSVRDGGEVSLTTSSVISA
eukprot:TRINITY_DN1791_c0_g1_i1.p1 TRINITY_DN1791_c0_g1~~TRINITY_DN1791_c0_g1_i1.p1  ORF type:complete len:514 (-),score=29.45 TRINITY_DN1791_c0_g1_i1:164-1705(-)